ncbi:MAG: hypothetical protein CL912_32995 [Deltaproteobacteria bacterium]|nr:hypothetical protein [Deltaproteobacteria bacterium]
MILQGKSFVRTCSNLRLYIQGAALLLLAEKRKLQGCMGIQRAPVIENDTGAVGSHQKVSHHSASLEDDELGWQG